MAVRTPVTAARGLGAAKAGFSHWWLQRVTSVALVPLLLWFAFSVASFGDMHYAAFVAWVGSPIPTVLLILLLATLFYHLQLGLRVIIEDYVHVEWMKLAGILLTNFACIFLTVLGVVAVLKIALGAGV
ncbi:MAG: succinate dehydrogenase, hydrophobic membrane anchor protein [Gammaproteobacteria bacterium]|nr:succinate dehydrogenase, hydrophobic membrane anchor protein [Gammaproteobacteria bacterium]MBA3731946.1 succinate dehydrogenase, hydrophobic membrane anchor protein [Gammaproteobacteria bacterium]